MGSIACNPYIVCFKCATLSIQTPSSLPENTPASQVECHQKVSKLTERVLHNFVFDFHRRNSNTYQRGRCTSLCLFVNDIQYEPLTLYNEDDVTYCKDAVEDLRNAVDEIFDHFGQYYNRVFVEKAREEDCNKAKEEVLQKITDLYDAALMSFCTAMKMMVERSVQDEEYKELCNNWMDALHIFYISMGGNPEFVDGFLMFRD